METFEVTQVIMTVGSTYEVRVLPHDKVVMTVKGSLMSPTPKFQLVVGDDGAELATLTGNFIKTKFQIKGAAKEELGALSFPAIAFKKKLVMTVGARGFTADGGIMGGTFRCIDNDGKLGIEIANKSGFHDRFHVTLHDGIASELGILATVAIHSRFFELV
jgi:uncharacterized protein YxjI